MNPTLVNVWRGNAIENYHSGAVAIVDAHGRVIWSIGEIQRPIFPRSAIKPLQAIALLDEKVEKKYPLTRAELALACASHTGEAIHTQALDRWLEKIKCTEDDLECGESYPQLQKDFLNAVHKGRPPSRRYHCCSGNHAGFLTLCRAYKEPTLNYRLYSHEVQKRWFEIVGDLTDLDPLRLPWGYDGCGIPTVAIPLQRLAKAYAKFADPCDLSLAYQRSISTIRNAIAENPTMFGGTNELTTTIAKAMPSSLIVKNGAEGVIIASLPEAALGIAIKIDSGNAQAAKVVLGAALEKIAVLSNEQMYSLNEFFRPNISNTRNENVGRAEPSSAWDQGVLSF